MVPRNAVAGKLARARRKQGEAKALHRRHWQVLVWYSKRYRAR